MWACAGLNFELAVDTAAVGSISEAPTGRPRCALPAGACPWDAPPSLAGLGHVRTAQEVRTADPPLGVAITVARPQSRQKSLNLVGANSVYRIVFWIFLCPSQCASALVSWPSFASLYPQLCRRTCGCTGQGSPASSPARRISRRTLSAVIGPPRSVVNTVGAAVAVLLFPVKSPQSAYLRAP